MNKGMRINQRGVGLIEVLVALLVLAIGVLGYAGLQLAALKGAEEANSRAQASLIAQDALERFWGNEDALATYLDEDSWPDTALAPGSPPSDWKKCTTAACSSTEMAAWDIKQLSWMAGNMLPAGQVVADACKHAEDLSCVAVSWQEQDPRTCLTNSGINTDEDSACVVLEVSR